MTNDVKRGAKTYPLKVLGISVRFHIQCCCLCTIETLIRYSRTLIAYYVILNGTLIASRNCSACFSEIYK